MVISALRPQEDILSPTPSLIPRKISLEFFRAVLVETSFPIFYKNSILVSFATTFVTVVISATAAHSLARLHFRGQDLMARAVLLAYLFPQIVLIVPLFVGIVRLNLTNTYAGLILTYITFTFPFATWMLTAYFQTVPKELEEAALIDGASNWQVFARVALPLARPGIVAAAVFAVIYSWNEFLYALVILNAEQKKTLSVGLYGFIGGEVVRSGEVLAAGTLMVIPVMVFFMLFQRHLVSGLTAGALKG
jgi:ABC-type glycerol-3-phosphate transport system permease component